MRCRVTAAALPARYWCARAPLAVWLEKRCGNFTLQICIADRPHKPFITQPNTSDQVKTLAPRQQRRETRQVEPTSQSCLSDQTNQPAPAPAPPIASDPQIGQLPGQDGTRGPRPSVADELNGRVFGSRAHGHGQQVAPKNYNQTINTSRSVAVFWAAHPIRYGGSKLVVN